MHILGFDFEMKKIEIGATSLIGFALGVLLTAIGIVCILNGNLEAALGSTLALLCLVVFLLLRMRRSQARLLERGLDLKRQLSSSAGGGVSISDGSSDVLGSTIAALVAKDLDRRKLAGGSLISDSRVAIEEIVRKLQYESEKNFFKLESYIRDMRVRQSESDEKILSSIKDLETIILASARKSRNHLSSEGAAYADVARRRFGDLRRESDRSTEELSNIVKMSEKRLVGLIEGSRFANDYEMRGLQDSLSALSESTQETNRSVSSNLVGVQQLEAIHKASREAARVESNQLGDALRALESSSRSIQGTYDQYAHISPESMDLIRAQTDKSLTKHRQTLVNRLTNLVRGETQQVEAIVQLYSKFTPRASMPPTGLWAIDARALLHLVGLVESTAPKIIVELGSGTSTIWLGYLAESIGAKLISFDHMKKYYDQTNSLIKKHGLENVIDLRMAELLEQEIEGVSTTWYNLAPFSDILNIDLLLIDGPPSNVGPAARYPALPVLVERMSNACVVVLDDSERDGEQEAIARWILSYPEFEQVDPNFTRLAVLQRKGIDPLAVGH